MNVRAEPEGHAINPYCLQRFEEQEELTRLVVGNGSKGLVEELREVRSNLCEIKTIVADLKDLAPVVAEAKIVFRVLRMFAKVIAALAPSVGALIGSLIWMGIL